MLSLNDTPSSSIAFLACGVCVAMREKAIMRRVPARPPVSPFCDKTANVAATSSSRMPNMVAPDAEFFMDSKRVLISVLLAAAVACNTLIDPAASAAIVLPSPPLPKPVR